MYDESGVACLLSEIILVGLAVKNWK